MKCEASACLSIGRRDNMRDFVIKDYFDRHVLLRIGETMINDEHFTRKIALVWAILEFLRN